MAASAEEEVFLWPCNLQAWQCWQAVQSQWRVGFGGLTGLDYSAVIAYLSRVARLRGAELQDVFEGVQACELAVLEMQAEQEREG